MANEIEQMGGLKRAAILLMALGDWARIMVALIIPILLGAAILEIYLTPQVVVALFGG